MREGRLKKDLEALFGRERKVRDHAFDVTLLLGDYASHEHFRKAPFAAHGFRQNRGGKNEHRPVGDHLRVHVATVLDRGREVARSTPRRKQGEHFGAPREFFRDEVGGKSLGEEKEFRVFPAALKRFTALHRPFGPPRPIERGDFRRVGGQNIRQRREDLTHGGGG